MSAMDSNRGSGTVESSLTALYPCAKLGLSDRMEAWGMVGLGTGELTIEESGGTPPSRPNLGMTMGAVGARGRPLSAGEGGGLGLAIRSDAVSNAEGNLAAAQAHVSRLRLIAEGSRTFAMANERTITPRGEVGVRHDLGDAETGTGLEAELGYGVGAPHGPGLVTPYAGLTLSGGAHRGALEHQRKTAMLSEHLTRTSARAETSRVRHTPSKTPLTRGLRTLAALTLSCLAVLGGTRATVAGTVEIWSATLTPEDGIAPGDIAAVGWDDNNNYYGTASLSDEDFSYGGENYDFEEIYWTTDDFRFRLNTGSAGDIATQTTRAKLTLYIGTETVNLGATTLSLNMRGVTVNLSTQGLTAPNAGTSITLKITAEQPTVTGIELTSAPGSDNTYAIGDIIQTVVTFSEDVDITGRPQLGLHIGAATKQADCTAATNTTTMTCSYTVVKSDTTVFSIGITPGVNGVGIGSNQLSLNGGTIKTASDSVVTAVLDHEAVARDTGHRVDGVRPTLITTGSDAPTTSADGTKIILTFSENISAVDRSKIDVEVNSSTASTNAHTVSGSKVELTLTSTITSSTATITVELEPDAVTDTPGNGNAATVTATVIGVPAAPTSLTAAAAATTIPPLAFDLSWTAPASDGGSAITKHQYRHKTGSGAFGSWTDIANSAAGGDNATSYTVKGLTASNPPTTFTFEVRAVNANDESTASNQASATVDVPASVFPTVTPGAGEVRVEWTTPANNGSAILKYQAWVFDDTNQIEITAYADIPGSDANTTSHTVTGLANGIAHVVAIRAVNSVGHSAASLPDAVTPVTVPTAPSNLEATPGDGSVRLQWQAPASDGGNTITGYEYRQKTGTGSFGSWMNIVGADENTTEHTVTLLTNGTAYTFEVQARNEEGDSGPSNQASATPAASDTTAPMLRSATTTALELKLFYDEVLDADSEPAPSAFTVTVNGASRAVTGVALDNTKVLLTLAPAVRAGETVTVSYTVPANDPIRDEASNPAAPFADHPVTNETPATAPDAPSSLEATPGDGSVTLRWTASAYDGGRAVTSHQYRRKTTGAFEAWQDIPESAPGGANAASYPVTRLTNGTAYTFEVRAWNVEGESGPSNQASATPATVPTAPRSFTATAGNGEVRLQWLAPASNGGSAILRYQYRQRYGSQAYGDWTNIADSAPGAATCRAPDLG